MSRPEGEPALPREELDAAIQARAELGAELEPHVIDGFLDSVGKAIDARVDERVAKRGRSDRVEREAQNLQVGVVLGSFGIGIPLTGAAGATAGTAGVVVVWIGIVLVNVAYALSRRR